VTGGCGHDVIKGYFYNVKNTSSILQVLVSRGLFKEFSPASERKSHSSNSGKKSVLLGAFTI
jgi:hypothetical protein